MVAWEYLVEMINMEYEVDGEGEMVDSKSSDQILQSRLSELGGEGWELVAFVAGAPAPHFKGHSQNPWVFNAVLKRPSERQIK